MNVFRERNAALIQAFLRNMMERPLDQSPAAVIQLRSLCTGGIGYVM